jgi:hypothetical protein
MSKSVSKAALLTGHAMNGDIEALAELHAMVGLGFGAEEQRQAGKIIQASTALTLADLKDTPDDAQALMARHAAFMGKMNWQNSEYAKAIEALRAGLLAQAPASDLQTLFAPMVEQAKKKDEAAALAERLQRRRAQSTNSPAGPIWPLPSVKGP